MTPVRYHVVPRRQIEAILRDCPIPAGTIQDYERLRPDVLADETQDIFAPNSRSVRHPQTRFELFELAAVPEDADFILVQNWLELCQSGGLPQNIPKLIDAVRLLYPHKPALYSWNHDLAETSVPALQGLLSHEFCLAYNTGRPTLQDILVPFWNVDCRLEFDPHAPRRFNGGFVGHCGGIQVRARMLEAFQNRLFWFVTQERFLHDIYLGLMRQFTFALCPRGGGLSSYRFFEAIQTGSIPVLFADDVALPFPDLDWGGLIVRIDEAQSGNVEAIWEKLQECDVTRMRSNLAAVRGRFSLAGVQTLIYERLRAFLER